MSSLKLCIALLFFLTLSACSNTESEVTGGRGPLVKDEPPPPSDDESRDAKKYPEQAVGFYAEGKLINQFEFPLEIHAVLKVFRARNRHFITNDLHDVIAHGAEMVMEQYPDSERLQIGDISKSGGGLVARHASHQNGLDADIAYYRVNRREMNPDGFGAFDEVFVKNSKVISNFDLERNYEFMKVVVSTGVVNRIFVDAAIKTKYCELSKKEKLTALDIETLRRMRPLENHADHMHLRIKCPRTSPNCQTQVEPPTGTGCPAPGQRLFNMFEPLEE